jgi:hypothetical protein
MKKPSGEGRVDFVEEFEKQQTDPISIGQESITAGVWEPFQETLGAQLPQFISKCTQRALLGRYSKGFGSSRL